MVVEQKLLSYWLNIVKEVNALVSTTLIGGRENVNAVRRYLCMSCIKVL